jgi:hypothetical protein
VILTHLQQLIGGIYDVSVTHDVYDFLVTDRRRLPACVRSRASEEDLIVEEPAAAGDEAAIALYLDPGLLERLRCEDPMVRLHEGNVADYCKALEGVSHFLYLTWNAGHDRPVSILELEMQAEVDKYITSFWLLRRQLPERFPAELRRVLFERARVDERLAQGREDLYREASRYAEKFCRRLEESLRRRGAGPQGEVLTELRRFYRLSNARKLAHIERFARP